MSQPLISIVIPVFNRESLLPQTLDSVLAQTYQNWECIIVDDGSSDKSAEVAQNYAKKDSRFRFFNRPSDRPGGGNAARNFGLEQSSGEFVNWFDSDDLMHREFLEKKIALFAADTTLDAVISKLATFDESPGIITGKETRTYLSDDTLTDFLLRKISWYLPDVMWKKAFLVEKPTFREDLKCGQDREFHVRMLLENPRLAICDAYLTICRKHGQNITSDMNKSKVMKKSHLLAVQALLDSLEQKSKLHPQIKQLYFADAVKYLPFVHDDPVYVRKLISLLDKLGWQEQSIFFKFRFGLARLTYQLTGRGYFLLE